MKYSICFSGHMRTYEICLKSVFLQDLLNNANKIYVSTWEEEDAVNNGNYLPCYPSKQKTISTDLDKIKNLYKTDNVKIFSYPIYENKYTVHNGLNFGKFESFLNMHYLIKECYQMVNDDSEIIIRIRPDVFVTQPIKIINDLLTFPKAGFLDGRLSPTDTFFYGNKKFMDMASSFYNFSDKYILSYQLNNWHERTFLKFLNDHKIPFLFQGDIKYQIVRHDFNHDTLGFYDDNGNLEIIKINKLLNNKII